MSDFSYEDIERRADLEMRAKVSLAILDHIEKRVIATFEDIINVDNVHPKSGDHAARQKHDENLKEMVLGVVAVHQIELGEIKKMVKYFEESSVISGQYKHDVSNYFNPVVSGLDILIDEIEHGVYRDNASDPMNERLKKNVKDVVCFWYRCRIALQDVLLSAVSEKSVPEKYQKGVDLKVLKSILDFFSTKEMASLVRTSQAEGSEYSGIEERLLNIDDVDWQGLTGKLAGRKIKGNDGVIGNYLINALRNSLKERIGAKNVQLKIDVVNDELIIRVEDDGKGMEQKHLDPNYSEQDSVTKKNKSFFIFNKGVSDTGSTGLGLANFNDRVTSMQGAVYVASKRRGSEPDDKPARYQAGGSDEYSEKISLPARSGTIFEIHLKLENKK